MATKESQWQMSYKKRLEVMKGFIRDILPESPKHNWYLLNKNELDILIKTVESETWNRAVGIID